MESQTQTKLAETEQGSTDSTACAGEFEYAGIPRSVVAPVFHLALRLRSEAPSADQIIQRTNTQLDHAIVSALIPAAARLLPLDDTPNGVRARVEKNTRRAEQADRAEAAFLAELTRQGYRFWNEVQQMQHFTSITPDVRFKEPTLICGHLCWWLEFKNFFGFCANRYFAKQNKKQLRRHAAQIGPGAVVYELGFETDHVNVEGVKSFRKEEVIKSLTWQGRGESGPSSIGVSETSTKPTVDSGSGSGEINLSKLDCKGQGPIEEKHSSRQRKRRLKKIRMRLQRTANAASVDTSGPKGREQLLG